MNNLTIILGSEAVHRELKVLHSTSWRMTEADSDAESQLPQIVTAHPDLSAKIENNLWSKLLVLEYLG